VKLLFLEFSKELYPFTLSLATFASLWVYFVQTLIYPNRVEFTAVAKKIEPPLLEEL
jgi:hypothetical protein